MYTIEHKFDLRQDVEKCLGCYFPGQVSAVSVIPYCARSSSVKSHSYLRDLADVRDLITTLKLPLEFAETLDTSVRKRF